MDVLVELLPPSYTAKTESSAKDSRRKNQSQYKNSENKALQKLNEIVEPEREDQQEISNGDKQVVPDIERRKGDERRQQRMKRGRWLESRDRNDRRATAMTVFVKV
ncbi:hypothetical protein EKO29_14630 [Colwellia sp. Arc7-635]|uniref:hypothetical protein n=1 Tax=Colwellia sp. Arc7-635 TaxID=2497879 RepID=UPI000F84EC7F|nr:hypothetical protein [Colwellia sp. Arc7-635]AZQ85108.1 hypothetical protein EKO29_14630 [Colwellia sp. Arc7-635]